MCEFEYMGVCAHVGTYFLQFHNQLVLFVPLGKYVSDPKTR